MSDYVLTRHSLGHSSSLLMIRTC